MGDTPSNYNIANGRMDGKSLGLKAILLHAQNQNNQELVNLIKQKQEAQTAEVNAAGGKTISPRQPPSHRGPSPRTVGQGPNISRTNEDEERKFVN